GGFEARPNALAAAKQRELAFHLPAVKPSVLQCNKGRLPIRSLVYFVRQIAASESCMVAVILFPVLHLTFRGVIFR
ncbi:MAG TPA: hypothetical protein VIJ06_07615, partial [Methylovirgula sp.]